MFLLLGKLLGIIPGLTQFGNNLVNKHYDHKTQAYMARTGATKEVAVAAITAQGEVAKKWWFVAAFPLIGFATPYAVWTWKAVAVDKVICPFLWGVTCSTDPLEGQVGWAYTIVVSSLFAYAIFKDIRSEP